MYHRLSHLSWFIILRQRLKTLYWHSYPDLIIWHSKLTFCCGPSINCVIQATLKMSLMTVTMMKQEVLCVFNEFCIFNNTSHASSAELLLLDINKELSPLQYIDIIWLCSLLNRMCVEERSIDHHCCAEGPGFLSHFWTPLLAAVFMIFKSIARNASFILYSWWLGPISISVFYLLYGF